MKTSFAEKVFWFVVALSSAGAVVYGYHRFKLIRPDLYGQPQVLGVSEAERAARIAEYQQKGDALTRAAVSPARTAPPARDADAPIGNTTCTNGFLVEIVHEGTKTDAQAVVVDGQPVHCTNDTAPTIR